MLRLIAILWVLLIGVQTVHQGLIYAYYIANKDFIAQTHCENKSKPELKCDGKCHLRKVLSVSKKEPIQEQQPFLPSFEELKNPFLFFQPINKASLGATWDFIGYINPPALFEYLFIYAYKPVFKALRPPQGV